MKVIANETPLNLDSRISHALHTVLANVETENVTVIYLDLTNDGFDKAVTEKKAGKSVVMLGWMDEEYYAFGNDQWFVNQYPGGIVFRRLPIGKDDLISAIAESKWPD